MKYFKEIHGAQMMKASTTTQYDAALYCIFLFLIVASFLVS